MSHSHTTTQREGLEDLFGSPISIYTDAQGVEDGLLVDLTQLARSVSKGFPSIG